MKTLRNLLLLVFTLSMSLSSSAQSIKDMIDSGTYYADENFMWYDFRYSSTDATNKAYSGYVVNATDNSIVNGLLLGYPAGDNGCKLRWDSISGNIVSTPAGTWSDNGFSSLGFKVGTPQLKYNNHTYPYIAIKFSHLPACGIGGWQDGNKSKERMWGGIRFHAVERAATAPNGINTDFWLRIPRTQSDADSMYVLKGDDVANWLTVYTPNDKDTVYIFNLRGAITRNHGSGTMSDRTDAVMDMYVIAQDVLSASDSLSIQWIRSFYAEEEAMEYVDDLYTGVKNVQTLEVEIQALNGKIKIVGQDNPTVEIFNFQGQRVKTFVGNESNISSGNYIVRITKDFATKTVKLIVR